MLTNGINLLGNGTNPMVESNLVLRSRAKMLVIGVFGVATSTVGLLLSNCSNFFVWPSKVNYEKSPGKRLKKKGTVFLKKGETMQKTYEDVKNKLFPLISGKWIQNLGLLILVNLGRPDPHGQMPAGFQSSFWPFLACENER